MPYALFKPKDPESRLTKASEEKVDNFSFNIFKFTDRPKPKSRKRVLIISCFSEFGCETLGCMYCIPRLKRHYPGFYVIAMGWYGREYLYRHLVDEFWELKEDYMWLREYARAFHHVSNNLKNLEESAASFGVVMPSEGLGKYAIGNICQTCGYFWTGWRVPFVKCPKCESTNIVGSIFSNIDEYKPSAKKIPKPSQECIDWSKKLIKGKTVGIFARGRKTYGRNLSGDFYAELINFLKDKGYNVIWLGEKQSTLPCPVDDVVDFSRMSESRDLEKTLAIVSQLEFTIQFWTASTRISAMVDTPFILVESPEQIYFSGMHPGQEGKRLELTTFSPYKIVLSHYLNFNNNPKAGLKLVEQAVEELKEGNYEDLIGLVENEESTKLLKQRSEEYAKGDENNYEQQGEKSK